MECAGEREKVALDTNMLTAVCQFRVDVIAGIESLLGSSTMVVPMQVVEELHAMGKKGGKAGAAAKMALGLVERRGIKVVSVDAGGADDALLALSKDGFKVATNDRALRRRIKQCAGHALYLRKKKVVALD